MHAWMLPCSHLDDNGLNLWTCKPAPSKCCPYKSCLGHGVCSRQYCPKTETGTWDWSIAVIGLSMLSSGRMWIWGLWIWKAVECFKKSLMCCPSRTMEDFVTESDLNCVDLAQEVSVENLNMWPWNCFCGILVTNVAIFCSCLKSLPEAKVKRLRLIVLKKEVSETPSIDFVLWRAF